MVSSCVLLTTTTAPAVRGGGEPCFPSHKCIQVGLGFSVWHEGNEGCPLRAARFVFLFVDGGCCLSEASCRDEIDDGFVTGVVV